MLFRSRVSRVTRKDSLTTAEFRVDANIGVAIETAHRLFQRRRIESDFRRQFGNRRCFDDIASPDPRLHREGRGLCHTQAVRSEEHTSELQSLMRSSYAVFCLKKKIEKL